MISFNLSLQYFSLPFQSSPTLSSRISPVPSPPLPPAPAYPQLSQGGATAENLHASSQLYQHLQQLHLQSGQISTGTPGYSPLLPSSHSPSPVPAYSTVLQQPHSPTSSAVVESVIVPAHQRSSSPPNFQNLHMIKEDSVDSDQPAMEEDGGGTSPPRSGSAPVLPQSEFSADLEKVASSRKMSHQNPQISITDAHGHVMAMAATPDSDEDGMLVDDVAGSSATAEPTPVVSSPLEAANPVPTPAATGLPLWASYSWYQPLYQQLYQNLASIPHTEELTDLQIQQVLMGYMQPGSTASDHRHEERASSLPPGGVPSELPALSFQHGDTAHYHGNPTNSVPDPRLYSQSISGSNSSTSGRSCSPATSNPRLMDMHFQTQSLDSALIHHFGHAGYGLTGGSDMSDAPPSWCSLTISKRTMSDLVMEIKKFLDVRRMEGHFEYRHRDNRFHLENEDLQLEMEVCPGDSTRELKVRRMSGDALVCHKLCNELLQCINA